MYAPLPPVWQINNICSFTCFLVLTPRCLLLFNISPLTDHLYRCDPQTFIVIRVAAGSSPLHCEHVDGHGKFHKAISIYLLNVGEGWSYNIHCATELLPCKHHALLRLAKFRGNQNKFAENQHFFNLFWTKIDNTFLQFVLIHITAFCTF